MNSFLAAITAAMFAGLTAGSLGLAVPIADAVPGFPGVPTCDPMDCLNNPASPSASEEHYLNLTRIAGGSDAQRLQIARATCAMLAGGTNPGQVIRDIASHLDTTNQDADQVMDEAMADICPGLHLGG